MIGTDRDMECGDAIFGNLAKDDSALWPMLVDADGKSLDRKCM